MVLQGTYAIFDQFFSLLIQIYWASYRKKDAWRHLIVEWIS